MRYPHSVTSLSTQYPTIEFAGLLTLLFQIVPLAVFTTQMRICVLFCLYAIPLLILSLGAKITMQASIQGTSDLRLHLPIATSAMY